MATYAIGDVQGCQAELEQLLNKINFDRKVDKLLFAGDLVNRGPESLGTLRLIMSLGDSAVCVLGNHDLHLLAQAYTGAPRSAKDNFDDVLSAPDREHVIEWLRHRPLAYSEEHLLMTHAGVPPQWDKQETLERAAELEALIQGPKAGKFFAKMYGNKPALWRDDLKKYDRARFITNALTRMRYCNADMSLNLSCKLPPAKAPSELVPWFKHPKRKPIDGLLLHGHWAALNSGEFVPDVISLDAGCVWGNHLCAWRVEDKSWHYVAGTKGRG